MVVNNIIQIAYTNSNCSDLWDVFIDQNKKFCNIPLKLISDKMINNIDTFLYDNNDDYYKVWINSLNNINEKYFIYLQEDFFLYDFVNYEKINEYVNFLNNNPEYSFIRLIKSGSLNNKKISSTLYEIESDNKNIFAMQSSIWRVSDYKLLMNFVKDKKWLENDNYRNAMIKLNMKGCYHYDNENKRGKNHYDSNVYPYIATALVRGKWNISEYQNELMPMLIEHNIDYNKRGVL